MTSWNNTGRELEQLATDLRADLREATVEIQRTKEFLAQLQQRLRGALDDLASWELITDGLTLVEIRRVAVEIGVETGVALTYLMIRRTASEERAERYLTIMKTATVL